MIDISLILFLLCFNSFTNIYIAKGKLDIKQNVPNVVQFWINRYVRIMYIISHNRCLFVILFVIRKIYETKYKYTKCGSSNNSGAININPFVKVNKNIIIVEINIK